MFYHFSFDVCQCQEFYCTGMVKFFVCEWKQSEEIHYFPSASLDRNHSVLYGVFE